ncbi:MAG TPA: ribosome biogenesis GTPase Der [Candidatus Saccharimonadales bacterium]|nr:ribosome biogenesis GTPase Der [Candidatus Saccharimonadales bacterium]
MSKKLPTVAVVGQTNVGKSSLFNRMVGFQQAVVAREAGTTRDKVVGIVEHNGQNFWLVDTAGLKDPSDEFEASIQEQITEATEAADLILVVVDSTIPPSDDDRSVAKKALKSRKPVILILNKVDKKESLPTEEFLRLGIKQINRTSAEHNRGVSALLDEIAKNIPTAKDTPRDDILRIAFIGRPNVGKSYLFNTLGGKQEAIVANVAGTTRDINRVRTRYKTQDIEILDTAGIRRSGKIETGIEKFSVLRTLQAIEEADVCLLLVDVNDLHVSLDQKLAGMIKESGKGLILVVSKWDTYEEKTPFSRDEIAKQLINNFQFAPWVTLLFTSAVTGQNVSKIFDLALDIYERRKTKRKTSELNKILQKCIEKHPPAGLKNTHPKLRYMVQTDVNPPWFVIYGSHLKFLHWSYKRYLEHAIREAYDYTGTSIKFSFREEKKERLESEK